MRLRGVDYGLIWAALGALGFFGEGYWFHPVISHLEDLTFVAKTVTLRRRAGNMILNESTWQPTKLFPNCVTIDFRKGIAINAVGLSNFGMEAALAKGKWQERTKPFLLSFMPIWEGTFWRLDETKQFVTLLQNALPLFNAPVALQVNLSCPNTGEDLKVLENEAVEILRILRQLNIPLVPKFNVMTSPETVKRISQEVAIDGVCISNTIPYGQLPEAINWENMFGTTSPLASLGGGGLSGRPLFTLVYRWVRQAREIGLSIPINAGGGIMNRHQVRTLFDAGANSISIASVIMLRPWRVPSIIRAAYAYNV